MKKIVCALATVVLLASCGNDADTTDTVSDSANTTIRGVENVNGNIPDTAATGAQPNASMHTDSAQ
ncbi:hypothetical protein [Pseudocnuella soli]|uniref:hypothetical protein n=1 Tax=Pseudocnuella soli TaxID=2502779 RepID=UPI001050826A|nr:hypothetical protein [Pseudocnuella soli]